MSLNDAERSILDILADGRPQSRANIAKILEKQSYYIGNLLTELKEEGLIAHIGPAEKSGLYTITAKGRTHLRKTTVSEEVENILGHSVNDTPEPTGPPLYLHPTPALIALLEVINHHEPCTKAELYAEMDEVDSHIDYLCDSAAYQDLITVSTDNSTDEVSVEVTQLGQYIIAAQDIWRLFGDRALTAGILAKDPHRVQPEHWFDEPRETIQRWANAVQLQLMDPNDFHIDPSMGDNSQ